MLIKVRAFYSGCAEAVEDMAIASKIKQVRNFTRNINVQPDFHKTHPMLLVPHLLDNTWKQIHLFKQQFDKKQPNIYPLMHAVTLPFHWLLFFSTYQTSGQKF